MKPISEFDVFKSTPSRAETKEDVTARAAWEIIARDRAATAAKTERLRAARLAQVMDEKPAAKTAKARKSR